MEKISYKSSVDIPVIAACEVLVVGSGPGGIGAGVMAASGGADTMVVERYGFPGGMAVSGEVSPFMPNHVKAVTLDGPVFVKWCQQMWKYRPADERLKKPFNADQPGSMIAKDEAMLAMEDILLEAGARLLYHHTLVDVICENKKIIAAVFASKSGLCAVKADIFIDSTGDGDLAALAGCPVEIGNADGLCQPMTTCFKLSGVNRELMPERTVINELYTQAQSDGRIDCPRGNVLWFNTPEADVVHFNTTRIIKLSAVDGTALSEAEIEGRRQARQIIDFLRTSVPGFANARIHSMAHHVGVRESRRILGLVYQTEADFYATAKYPDGIAKANYSIDIHNPQGKGTVQKYIDSENDWYEIRYGTLVPQNSSNLLMGCRAISIDHALHSSARIMPVVCALGQAAGAAAVMCLKKHCSPAELDGAEVRKTLAEAGAKL